MKKSHIRFPVFFDEGSKVSLAFGAQIQTTVLIDKEGVIRYIERGFPEDIEKRLKKLLE